MQYNNFHNQVHKISQRVINDWEKRFPLQPVNGPWWLSSKPEIFFSVVREDQEYYDILEIPIDEVLRMAPKELSQKLSNWLQNPVSNNEC